MKRIILTAGFATLLFASCVSMKEYETLQAQYTETAKRWNVTKQELQELREENAALVRDNQAKMVSLSDATAKLQDCESKVSTLNRAYADLQLKYDTTMENYMQQITGKNRDLNRATQMLDQRTRELNDKAKAFEEKERKMLEQQQALESRQSQLEAQEAAARKELEAKQQELENIRGAVSKALVGFSDMGLNVETKEGKVYVSMEDKLLFASGSWMVSAKGVEAIKMLAKVLEENTDLNVMVEGHTDNDAYHGSTAVKDNWDLSVMRATAVVKALLGSGDIEPVRLSASGRSEYLPLDENNTPEARAKNRRTEIILTPNLDQLFQLIQGN